MMSKTMNVKAIMLSMALAGAVTVAHAATVAESNTKTADVIFTSSSVPYTFNLNPNSNLTSGYSVTRTKILDWTLAGPMNTYALRITPDLPTQDLYASTTIAAATFHGKTNNSNTFTATLRMPDNSSSSLTDVSGEQWLLTEQGTSFASVLELSSSQDIHVDTYPISIDAAVYIP